jgi:hypothetical protein
MIVSVSPDSSSCGTWAKEYSPGRERGLAAQRTADSIYFN